jgi:TRAP-type uncharacterized transport system substrate-binding protein
MYQKEQVRCAKCYVLRNDIAVILTEGIVKDILAGNASKIVQVYVESPLIWGIHVAANSGYKTISDIENTKVAISRLGSGSQLMALSMPIIAWETDNLQFEIINTIDEQLANWPNGTCGSAL